MYHINYSPKKKYPKHKSYSNLSFLYYARETETHKYSYLINIK